jgi:tetratricopeptide (TPR) repeat protein
MQRGQWSAAYDLALGIETRFPEYRELYEVDCALGRCLAMQKQFDAARQRLERVLHAPQAAGTETAATAEWWIAETFFRQQRWDDAIPAYVRAAVGSHDPNLQARALLQLGKCYDRKGDTQEARRRFDQVVNEYGRTPFAEEALQHLQTLGSSREALQPSDATGTRR